MATHQPAIPQPHGFVRLFKPLMRGLIGFGLRLGPNVLLTVPGRKSGLPRTTPVALLEIDGRRWLVGTYGDVHWVRNLRAAGGGEIRRGSRTERVLAHELDAEHAAHFFRHVLRPHLGRMPVLARLATKSIVSLAAPQIFGEPERAALSRPVFELLPCRSGQGGT